jgi:hypothetical protein
MRISCFTFLRNCRTLGFPFIESIRSALPLCDEYVINIGEGQDETLAMVKAIGDPRIRILESRWNDRMTTRGYVYGQQKNIAHFNCTGDWAFYLEADEVLHEADLPRIRETMERHLDDNRVEALVFDYLHFYGNCATYAWGPHWYRRAPRIIRNSIRSYSPDGLFFVVLDSNKRGRYPRAALANATVYHYGWARTEQQMNEKSRQVSRYWGVPEDRKVIYGRIDPALLRVFTGSHPAVMQSWIAEVGSAAFSPDPDYRLTGKDRKHRLGMLAEKILGIDLSKKHFTLVRE